MYAFLFIMSPHSLCSSFFFFNDTATTEIYTLSLHDALPIYLAQTYVTRIRRNSRQTNRFVEVVALILLIDPEADTVEAQSHFVQEIRRENVRFAEHQILGPPGNVIAVTRNRR